METLLLGPTIYTEQATLPKGAVQIREGKIVAVTSSQSIKHSSSANVLHFPEDYHVIPGFIDLHVHGANGKDVMDATPEALTVMSQSLAKEGTTAFLATTMTASVSDIEKALLAVHDYMHHQKTENTQGAEILGAHLEGPFISAAKIGAQSREHLLEPDIRQFDHWQTLSHQSIKLVTLAPELAHSTALIRHLCNIGVVASMGHSDATYEEALAAIQEGSSYSTHLFNAMRGLHHRDPGLVGAVLSAKNVVAELIADGVHIHPTLINMALKLKEKKDIVLVTDAMRAKCLGDGCYDLGGQTVHVKAGVATLENGTLAGSLLTMSGAIKNLLQWTDCTLSDVIQLASANPAKVLKLFDRKGSITINKDADLVVLDDKLNVVLTLVGGKEVCH